MTQRARRAGFINPGVFARRNLEYRIRLNRAPSLGETITHLEKGAEFNSYLVRGEYDVVSVSLESAHFLFRALIERRLEDLKLRDTFTLTVDEFLKYHGCLVTPILGDDPAFLAQEAIFHYLFNASRDWDSVPDRYRRKLLEMNLLMMDPTGRAYEDAEDIESEARLRRRTIVRVGFGGGAPESVLASLKRLMAADVVPNPLVRSCYALRASSSVSFLLELVGLPGEIDVFLIKFHRTWEATDAPAPLFTRCDEVIRRLSGGHANVLLTIQARPDLIARAEERLLAPLVCGWEEGTISFVGFIEESEAVIRGIASEDIQKAALDMLAEVQLAVQLANRALLEEAMNAITHRLVGLMLTRLAALYGCADAPEAVTGELKRRGMFREHTPTFGNLHPVFFAAHDPEGRGQWAAEKSVFERFDAFRNAFVFGRSSRLPVQLTDDERQQAKRVFCELLGAFGAIFSEEDRSGKGG